MSSLFHKEKSIIFAKVNCLETPGMCGFFNAPKVPAFRYLPFNTTGPAVKQLHFEQGEDMIDYLNAELGGSLESAETQAPLSATTAD